LVSQKDDCFIRERKQKLQNKNCPLVSILIPLYNHERYIIRCIESAVSDPYPNKEIIIIDDGSKDNSLNVVKAWHALNSHLFQGRLEIRSRPNRGVSKTLNELLAMANGEFIAFLSSDDYLLPGGIQVRVDYLRQHTDRMMVLADYQVVDEKDRLIHESGIGGLFRGEKSYLADERLIGYELTFHWCIAGPVYMGRRELYRMIDGYDESLVVEDWAFCLKIIGRNLMGFIDYPVAAYRLHGKGKIDNLKFNESMLKTVSDNMQYFTGLCRFYLLAEKLTRIGLIARLKRQNRFRGFLIRKAGRIMRIIAKQMYGLMAPLIYHAGKRANS
jgi:glycosyltransferase involved in cell wall biosynthesis